VSEDRRLAFLRELERADEAASAVLAELDELTREIEALRARAIELETFLARLPAERERLVRGIEDAEREVGAAREALAAAERELEAAGRDGKAERIAAARRAEVRTRDRVRDAERRLADLRARSAQLEKEAEEAAHEAPRLEEHARALARALRGRPRLAERAGADPAPGLAGAADWAAHALAALFLARGGLAAERDAVIRQANELGALVLGEPLIAASASSVARRVEQALES
jgi:DNA repair exonuclease SbcCD ATPase subunit